ncbi:MAG: TIGR03620 family F420-dependent LLM class oxidoreductase [Acidimicrobiales bacterium]
MTELPERLGSVGLWISPPPGDQAADVAVRAEALGVKALWVGGGNADPEALARRAAMLAATDSLVVATGIVNIWAWAPDALHAEAAAIEDAYPGRFVLGLGVSHESLVNKLGRTYERPLAAMRAFLDDLDAVTATKKKTPPRVLAALGPKMLALARDRSAGAHPYLVTPDHTRAARQVLGSGPLLAPEQAVVVTDDPDGAGHKIARHYLATYLQLPNYLSNLRQYGFDDGDFAGGGSDRLVDALVPSGAPADIAERVRAHLAAGADHVCVQPLGENRAVDLEGFAAVLGHIAG